MEEIYSTPFDKKGTSKEYGTAAYWLAEQRELLRKGQLTDPRSRTWTVYEWADHWHNTLGREVADNTTELYQVMIKIDLKATPLGNMPVPTVQPSDITTWLRDMNTNRHWTDGPNLAVSTVNVRRAMIGAVFNAAVNKKIRLDNPVKTAKRLREEPGIVPIDPKDIPTRDQLWKWYDLAADISPHLQEAILIAAGTGLRPGELFGMEESQLTRNKRGRVTEIYVSRQLKLGKPGTQFGRLKTDNSYRRIPVGEEVANAIDRYLASYQLEPDRPNGTVILRDPRGKPWSRSTFTQHWVNIRDAAVTPAALWYRFRHYYVSALIEGNASPRLVMERAGHSSSAYTLTRYARLWPNADMTTAVLSDAALKRDINGTRGQEPQ